MTTLYSMDADAALATSPDGELVAVAFSLRAPVKSNHPPFFQSPSKRATAGDAVVAPIIVIASARDLTPLQRVEVSDWLPVHSLFVVRCLHKWSSRKAVRARVSPSVFPCPGVLLSP